MKEHIVTGITAVWIFAYMLAFIIVYNKTDGSIASLFVLAGGVIGAIILGAVGEHLDDKSDDMDS